MNFIMLVSTLKNIEKNQGMLRIFSNTNRIYHNADFEFETIVDRLLNAKINSQQSTFPTNFIILYSDFWVERGIYLFDLQCVSITSKLYK